MNHEKLLKRAFIGLAFYGVAELMYQVGKGDMLGILSHDNVAATDVIKDLSEWKMAPYSVKIILGSCKMKQKYLSKREKSC